MHAEEAVGWRGRSRASTAYYVALRRFYIRESFWGSSKEEQNSIEQSRKIFLMSHFYYDLISDRGYFLSLTRRRSGPQR